jgi:hypothetical protein
MDGVKAKEYQIAKQEVMKAQARIDQARIEQIEKISETQARQLTALEKVRVGLPPPLDPLPLQDTAAPREWRRVCQRVGPRLQTGKGKVLRASARMLTTQMPCAHTGAAETAAGHAEERRKGRREVRVAVPAARARSSSRGAGGNLTDALMAG